MKRIPLLLGVFLLLSISCYAQSGKLVFIEEFTQLASPPCVLYNPDFDELTEANKDKVVVLKYHTHYPGFDPLNIDNPIESEERGTYYENAAIPLGYVNGQSISTTGCATPYIVGHILCLDQAEIDMAYNLAPLFDFTLSAARDDESLRVQIKLSSDLALKGHLKLRIVLAEKWIDGDDLPLNVGGQVFRHVMKKFIPHTAGIDLGNSWIPGEERFFEEELNLADLTIYHEDRLEVIAFVQDDLSKEVLQVAIVDDGEVVSTSDQPVANMELEVFPNPFTDQLNIKVTHPELISQSIELRSAAGKTLRFIEPGARQLDLSELPAGLYFLHVRIGGELWIERLVKLNSRQ